MIKSLFLAAEPNEAQMRNAVRLQGRRPSADEAISSRVPHSAPLSCVGGQSQAMLAGARLKWGYLRCPAP